MIAITLTPASKPGTFWPMRDGVKLTKATRQPFYDGARALRAAGAADDAILVASHAGASTVALRSTVGEAAQWSVSEPDRGNLRRIPYAPYRPE
jgi:hypothetical protein